MWTVIVSDQRGQEVARHDWQQGSLTIGRDQGRNIVLPSKSCSRRHARLDMIGGMPVVVDEGSANGTIVNGARISGPMRLDENSKVEVGEFLITLQKPEDEEERTVLMKPKAFSAPPARPAAPPPPPPPPPRAAPPPPPPPSPPRIAPTQELGVVRFPDPPAPKAPAPDYGTPKFPDTPRPAAGNMPHGSDVTSQFDRHLRSVRNYREETQAATLSKRGKIDAEWATMIGSARALQARLSTDKRVLSFAISRDQKEIAVKILDPHEKRGQRYFLLSREHPEGKYPGVDSVWLREFGRDDASFDSPNAALEELMLRVAGTLA